MIRTASPCDANGQPVQCIDEQGNPAQVGYAPQPSAQYTLVAYAPKPIVFNISPEQFALIQRGGALSQAGINSMLGVTASVSVRRSFVSLPLAATMTATIEPMPALVAGTAPAAADKKASKKSKKKKKKLSFGSLPRRGG